MFILVAKRKVAPKKRRVRRGWGGGGGRGSGRTPHFNFGNFFFFKPGVKLDEQSIENGLEVQKFLVECLFWGGCHHPSIDFLGSIEVVFQF